MPLENLPGYYEFGVQSEEYDYGEYFEDIVYPAEILNAAENKHLVEGLYEYYSDKGLKRPKKKASKTVKESKRKLSRGSGGLNSKCLDYIREAVNEGYIWKFKLDIPWHPRIFRDNERVYTFPHQHETAVLYTGQPRHLFFDWQGKKDLIGHYNEPRNPKSILEQGEIKGGNQWVDGSKDYEGKNHIREVGVWLGLLDKAKEFPSTDEGDSDHFNHKKIYNGSVVFEVELKTSNLIAKGGAGHSRIENLSDTSFDAGYSPLKYTEVLDRQNEFLIPYNRGGLDIKKIVGVWDKGKYEYPHFISFPKFVNLMRKKFPERMPNSSKNNNIQTSNKKKKKEQQVEKIIENDTTTQKLMKLGNRRFYGNEEIKGIFSDELKSNFEKFENDVYNYEEIWKNNSSGAASAHLASYTKEFIEKIPKWNKLCLETAEASSRKIGAVTLKNLVENPKSAEKLFEIPNNIGEVRIEIIRSSVKNNYSEEKIRQLIQNKIHKKFLSNLKTVKVTEEMIERIIEYKVIESNELTTIAEKKVKRKLREELEEVNFEELRKY